MTADPKRVQAVFLLAVELNSPADRAELLDRECGADVDLRRRVEALLLAHDAPDSSLDRPLVYDPHASTLGSEPTADMPARVADDPPSTVDHAANPGPSAATTTVEAPRIGRPPAEGPGSQIGPYTLLRVIGEGGMGVVYEAEQTEPVRRTVALKVIKTGMDTEAVVARFEAERQALALMEHPNIARVLDAGSTATGRPFFVMEFVRGERITSYCDNKRMSVRDRLALFVPVCQAIQHAHQKGIIHRDIKPSNVLVTEVDGKPVPKVIDFGVAKAVGQRLSDRMRTTQYGMLVGTPEYMSPEQASLGALDIDTRSDVYALGVLLYELLAGSTPLEGLSLRQAALDEVLRRIREEEPPKPSTRLAGAAGGPASVSRKSTPQPTAPALPTSRDRLPSIAATRSTEPGRLARQVRGDLDWVVMKAIEKDRARRYETANGLAREIQRFLDGDPVEAGPPSAMYRLKKFARKHRVALVTVAAFAGLLVAATAVSAGLALWANRERMRAEEREDSAINAVKRFRDAVAGEPELKNSPELEELRKRLLKEPLAFFRDLRDRLQADRDTRPASLMRLARASFDLGRLIDEIGHKEDALIAMRESLAIRQRLADAIPTDPEFQLELANNHNEIGLLVGGSGKLSEAMISQTTALAIRQKLAETNPSNAAYQRNLAKSHNNIAVLLGDMWNLEEALKEHESALSIRKRLAAAQPSDNAMQGDLANSYLRMSVLLIEMRRPKEALKALEEAQRVRQKLADTNPADSSVVDDLAHTHYAMGLLSQKSGKPAEALKAYEQALATQQKLAAAKPTNTGVQDQLASYYHNVGTTLADTRKPAEAIEAHEKALAIWRRLAEANPTVTSFQCSLVLGYSNLGYVLNSTGRQDEAMEALEASLAAYRRMADGNHDAPELQSVLANSYGNLGFMLNSTGRAAEGLKVLEASLAIRQKLADAHPDAPENQNELANAYLKIAACLGAIGKPDEAMTAYESGLAVKQRLADAYPSNLAVQRELADAQRGIGDLFDRKGNLARALESYSSALAIRRKLFDADPAVADFQKGLADVYDNIGPMLIQTGDPARGLEAFEAALAIRRTMLREDPDSPDLASCLGATLNNLAMTDLTEHRFKEARDRLREAIVWQRKALTSNSSNPTYRQFLDNHLFNLIRAARELGDSESEADAERELAKLRESDPVIMALNARLAAVIQGEQQPKDNSERLALAQRAYDTKRYAVAAQLWGEALESDPKLGDDRQAQHRYNAACAAALAAAGQSKVEPLPDNDSMSKFRAQALAWLEAELAVWTELIGNANEQQRAAIVQILQHWQEDSDLAGFRDETALTEVPADEQTKWRGLWANVAQLLERAKAGP